MMIVVVAPSLQCPPVPRLRRSGHRLVVVQSSQSVHFSLAGLAVGTRGVTLPLYKAREEEQETTATRDPALRLLARG